MTTVAQEKGGLWCHSKTWQLSNLKIARNGGAEITSWVGPNFNVRTVTSEPSSQNKQNKAERLSN